MIQLHHLNKSRSKRIIWLLEELDIPYEIRAYRRDPKTHLAPPELRAIHPLGKSPVIEEDGQVIAESGAIIEYLTDKYGQGKLSPAKDSPQYPLYLQWLHFAESSLALPLLMSYFLQASQTPNAFLDQYSQQQTQLLLNYLNGHLTDRQWLLGENFSAADIMLSFMIEMAAAQGLLSDHPALLRYFHDLQANPHAQKANQIEKQHG